VGEDKDILKAPADFPKCGDYLPPVAEPPIMSAKRENSIALQNGSDPHQPHYDIMSSTPTTEDLGTPEPEGTHSNPNHSTHNTPPAFLFFSSVVAHFFFAKFGGTS